MKALHAGDTLLVRGGTYSEQVMLTMNKGTATSPVKVKNYTGERPVIKGLLWLKGADYWTLDGINVTWSTANSSGQHMVKMTDGAHWRLTNAEFWGARSYAALLVTGAPSNWQVDHSYIHDTYKAHSLNQDHLIYVNAGTGAGVIERNVLVHSANGRGIKIGPSSGSSTRLGNLVVRYNTVYDNLGPTNVQLSYATYNVQIYRNILDGAASRQNNVDTYNLKGTGNVAYENAGWASSGVVVKVAGLTDGGGNIVSNPGFTSSTTNFGAVPSKLSAYGRYAP